MFVVGSIVVYLVTIFDTHNKQSNKPSNKILNSAKVNLGGLFDDDEPSQGNDALTYKAPKVPKQQKAAAAAAAVAPTPSAAAPLADDAGSSPTLNDVLVSLFKL